MHPTRIAELLDPFLNPCHSEKRSDEEPAVLSPALLHSISTYIDILVQWNARINLTAIRDPDQIVTRHFGESLFAARHLFPLGALSPEANREGHEFSGANIPPHNDGALALEGSQDRQQTEPARVSVADLGSGAGFPGFPIKFWTPHISLTLIESNQKKATFLREVTRALTLTDVDIQNSRAEALAGTTFDLVTLRAVESFGTILPVATSLVAPGGRLALLIGSAQLDPAQSALPQLSWSAPEPIPTSRNRILAVAHRPT
jgi:16S rRNA (guanine527-N7)-methyltransferase